MKKLTEGKILSSILSISIPVIFANLLQTGYQLIDTFWVGKLGEVAVASVSLTFPLIFLFISLGSGLAIAGAILVAQYAGKGDGEKVNYIATQTLIFILLISLFISILGYFLTPYIIKFFTLDKQVYLNAVSYMQISFIGLFFMFGYMVFQSLMRGIGEVKVPVYIVLLTVILNFFLDPLFIFGYGLIPGYGVSGAAIASLITEAISMLIGMALLFSNRYGIKLTLSSIFLDFSLAKKMFFLGLPASVEQVSRSFGMIVLISLVSSFGTIALASYGIGIRILSFVIIPSVGFSMATSTLVGQNIGAGKMERVYKIVKMSLLISFASLSLFAFIFFIFSKTIASFFLTGSPYAIEESSSIIKLFSLGFPFLAVFMVVNGVFRGSGNTKLSMLLSLISFWVFRLPIAYLLSKHLFEYGIWYAFPLSNFLIFLVSLAFLYLTKWDKRRITQEIEVETKIEEEVLVEEPFDS